MVVRPGPTVQDYLQGKRARYQSPLAYFAIGYLVFWACAHFVAEPNGLPAGTMATMSREVLFAGMIGMSLLGYVATTRPVLNFVETTVLFAFLYGTICFVAPVAIAMVIPFRSAVARLSQPQQDLVIDVPVIAFLAYMGYDACKTLGIPFWRFLVAVVGGVLYFVLFREVLGFK
jgi:hypothetical protein